MTKTVQRAAFVAALAVVTTLTGFAQVWLITSMSDALTGKSYTLYVLPGKFLTPPWKVTDIAPTISLRCDPASHRGKVRGKLIEGFIVVNTVIDLKNGGKSTVQYRLDDGKLQDAEGLVGNSTDYQAISFDDLFLDNLIWGHQIYHKPGTSQQIRKVVIGVQEHLAGQIVMQFDLPDSEQVAAACGTEYSK